MFKYLTGAEQVMAAKTLLLRIHVITGWTMPSAEMLNILNDQFYKKILENYSDFNVEEIEYAFRDKGTIVEDWGKEINLNLIDKILIPYREERYEASVKLERLLPPPEPRRWTAEDILNSYRSDIEVYFQAIKKGYQPIIHKYFEETLRGDGMMKEGETIGEFFVRKLNSGTEHLYVKE